MPDLNFEVVGAEPDRDAISPRVRFQLRVRNAIVGEQIHAVMLRTQIRLETTQRHYSGNEQEGLRDLFGDPPRWGHTLRSLLWSHCHVSTQGFAGSVDVDLPVDCTFDFNVATTKYFHALEEGQVPLTFLFSGTIFYFGPQGTLQVMQIPWEKECRFSFPVSVWKEMMEQHYPRTAWLSLRKDVFDRLHRFKVEQSLPTWEQVIERLLMEEEA